MSHPTWVRGLKHVQEVNPNEHFESHPTWVRGLKLGRQAANGVESRRTLRGCVD